jgi:lipopolysaccharide transport system permease protein
MMKNRVERISDNSEPKWTIIHRSGNGFDLRCITDVFRYSFLIRELTIKGIRSVYTQTLLGPFWLIVQPLLTSVVFVHVFQKILGIPVQGHSSFVFYSSGVVLWGYFAKSVNAMSNIFINNHKVFGKLVFPRLVVPVAEVIANLFKFSLQFLTLLVIYLFFFKESFTIISPVTVICFVVALLQVTIFATGMGMISASLSTVFRDMSIIVTYIVNLLFYATPILYPINKIPGKMWRVLQFNPMTSAIDIFRYPFSGSILVNGYVMLFGAAVSVLFCLVGLIMFVIVQRSCIDKI